MKQQSLRISGRVQEVEMSGIRKFFQQARPDAISLGLGQPDFPTPDHIKDAAIEAMRNNLTGYTFNTGVYELREAICSKLAEENGITYTPDQVIVTAGAGEALFITITTLVDEGDRVLFADPGFVSYEACAVLAGGRPDGIPLDDTLHLDVEACKEKMDGAKVFVLNSPANPTGTVEDPGTIRAIVEYAADAGVTVISDEVYEHFIYGKEHASAARFGENVVTINATSKTYAMTGWRLGYMAAPDAIVGQAVKVHQYCQTCATSISQYAAIAAYTGGNDCVRMMKDEYAQRRDLLYDGLTRLGFDFPKPEGAFYMFVPMERELFQAIIDAGVVIIPGDAFGANAGNYARFSYAASRENITEALKRIATVTG